MRRKGNYRLASGTLEDWDRKDEVTTEDRIDGPGSRRFVVGI